MDDLEVASPISVSVLATEPLREAGIREVLRRSAGVTLRSFVPGEPHEVIVADLGRLVDDSLRPLKRSHERYGSVTVAIVDKTTEVDLRAAAGGGVVGVMHSLDTGRNGLLSAVLRASGKIGRPGAARLDQLAEQMRRLRDSHADVRAVPELSDREAEVLRRIAGGLDTNLVAQSMQLSERTVKYTLWCIMRRFSLHNRVHAVAFAIRAGVI
ncbi:LuxR C-terminal-related transcriptional regulator [Actinoplanes sp. NPDC051470]|uniref:helix-turn-helix transcriptional regulator n=1 Tax=Actinoplanes sp. NPDC051470 TaxID=3157224 RepID=UPI0034429347